MSNSARSLQEAPGRFSSLATIAALYDGFIIDLWGVIHDGQHAYEGAAECVKKLKDSGKTIWFLSNAPRRAHRAEEGLKKFGISRDLYDGVLTSGEMAFNLLTARNDERFCDWSRNYLFIGPERDRDLMNGSNFEETSVDIADFVLNVGFDDDVLELSAYLPTLAAAASRNLPMICTNPDKIIVRLDGSPFPCAGLLAEEYEKMGGKAYHIGKPWQDVYGYCLDKIGRTKKILAIGDNLDTDILGANNNGIDSALITGGILRHRMGLEDGELPAPDALASLCAEINAWPEYILPWFKW